jgi:hypothetical protein
MPKKWKKKTIAVKQVSKSQRFGRLKPAYSSTLFDFLEPNPPDLSSSHRRPEGTPEMPLESIPWF